MTASEKKEIIAYLSGPRNYAKGVALYERLGHNRMFKRRFLIEETECTRSMLAEELRKLAGITDEELRRLPRQIVSTVSAKPVPQNCTPLAKMERIPPKAMENIRLRDKFPFLQEPNCPDILKIIVADMITDFGQYHEAFKRLQELPADNTADAFIEASKLVEAYLTNREAWEELEYFKANGVVLGQASKFSEIGEVEDLRALSDIELIKKLNSAKANQSKRKKELKLATESGADATAATEALDRWTTTRARIEAEIEARKKK